MRFYVGAQVSKQKRLEKNNYFALLWLDPSLNKLMVCIFLLSQVQSSLSPDLISLYDHADLLLFVLG